MPPPAQPYRRLAILVFLLVFVVAGVTAIIMFFGREKPTRWIMINVSPAQSQADCHLLELPDGRLVLIDAAEAADAPGTIVPFLKRHRVRKIDLVVLSHFHWDHYGKLVEIINAGIAVDRVAINLPGSREIADVEKPWGCNWEDVQAVLSFLNDHKIPFFTPKIGERLIEIKQGATVTSLEVVCLYDGINTPVGRTDMNDTSMILRLTHGPTRVLFTGDLNQKLGTWLANSSFDLKADILKVPHHGTEGLAPNEFFDKVAPKVAMVPSPKELWFSLRSKRPRDYFSERKIPAYVNGLHGTVTVAMTSRGYEIKAEHPDPKP